jgi:hypothetical protein
VSLINVCSKYNKDFLSLLPHVRTLNIFATKDNKSKLASGWVQSKFESEHMGRKSSPKSFKRTEDKWNGKLQRTPNRFKIHEAPRPNEDN